VFGKIKNKIKMLKEKISVLLIEMLVQHYYKLEAYNIDKLFEPSIMNMIKEETILNFLKNGNIWIAFGLTVSFPIKIPDSIEKEFFGEKSTLLYSNPIQLDQKMSSSLWISAKCGAYLIEQKKFSKSLIFWNYFFILYLNNGIIIIFILKFIKKDRIFFQMI
jgi:hypothetical protein